MKRFLFALLSIAASFTMSAQAYNAYWKKADGLPGDRTPIIEKPQRFLSYTIAEQTLKALLDGARSDYQRAAIIDLPTPDGSFRSFRVWNTPMMAEGLAKSFPQLATYTAEAVGAPQVTAKLDYSPYGFHALVFDGHATYFIEPYDYTGDGAYLVFYKKDLSPSALHIACGVNDESAEWHAKEPAASGGTALRINGAVTRKYRLALACTGEYAVTVAGPTPTTAAVMANLLSVANRVNGVFERELAITLEFVSNEASIIYLDGATDPYNNSSTSQMLGQNQSNLDSKIGTAGYDIGHALNVSGLGLGLLGCVCGTGSKAQGASFYNGAMTYQVVAHEMGHQFSANHTFNSAAGSCAGNGNQGTAFEPGSGSTLMGYPGLCSTDDIQGYHDDYYHSKSLEEITSFISNNPTCPTTNTSGNQNATLPLFSKTYSIPFKTPFELTAPVATDATQDTLSWCWEERDLGNFGGTLASTGASGPLFRTFSPTTDRTRVFPRIESVNGTMPLSGEKLPDVARSMLFKVVERDIYQGWGTFNYPDDTIRLNVVDTKVPFTVTYPTGGEIIRTGSLPAIRWNIAGTTSAPISCPNVDIYLSVDNGFTYPYLLRANTQNDGYETVVMPTIATAKNARIKVKCSNNVFFNISAGSFTLQGPAGVAQTSLTDDVRISPVPARDVLNIDMPAALGIMQIQVINTLGQLVWHGTVNAHTSLDVSGWARGLYQVHMYNENGTRVGRKVVVE